MRVFSFAGVVLSIDWLPGVFSGAGLYVYGARDTLVQPEMERWYSPLVSEYTAIFAALWKDFTFIIGSRSVFLWLGDKQFTLNLVEPWSRCIHQ